MQIHEASQGINIVVETDGVLYIGRMGKRDPKEVTLHHCSVHPIQPGENTERHVQQTAKYGVSVDQRDVRFETSFVKRVRVLGNIPKG